jgi:hypothetical protein
MKLVPLYGSFNAPGRGHAIAPMRSARGSNVEYFGARTSCSHICELRVRVGVSKTSCIYTTPFLVSSHLVKKPSLCASRMRDRTGERPEKISSAPSQTVWPCSTLSKWSKTRGKLVRRPYLVYVPTFRAAGKYRVWSSWRPSISQQDKSLPSVETQKNPPVYTYRLEYRSCHNSQQQGDYGSREIYHVRIRHPILPIYTRATQDLMISLTDWPCHSRRNTILFSSAALVSSWLAVRVSNSRDNSPQMPETFADSSTHHF